MPYIFKEENSLGEQRSSFKQCLDQETEEYFSR